MEQLDEASSAMADALVFMQRIVRAHVARERHAVLLEAKRRQDRSISSFISELEVRGARGYVG